ncbi:MAG: hypothetical protein OQK24_12975 [Magnetovibrio sp.]|nr:hypothetical protein [Magnetovibrio sp.]
MKIRDILKPRWATAVSGYSNPTPIIATAAIASSGQVGGRLIPLVILDSSEKPALDELIRLHAFLPPGDVRITWGQVKELKDHVVLHVEFLRPMETEVHLEFEIGKYGGLVDQIFSTRVLYVMTGRSGDRFVDKHDDDRISVEIPDTGFFKVWDEMFYKNTIKQMRQKGLGRQEAKRAAREYIEQWRNFDNIRV